MNIYTVSYRERVGATRAFKGKVEVFKRQGDAYERAAKLARSKDALDVSVAEQEVQD